MSNSLPNPIQPAKAHVFFSLFFACTKLTSRRFVFHVWKSLFLSRHSSSESILVHRWTKIAFAHPGSAVSESAGVNGSAQLGSATGPRGQVLFSQRSRNPREKKKIPILGSGPAEWLMTRGTEKRDNFFSSYFILHTHIFIWKALLYVPKMPFGPLILSLRPLPPLRPLQLYRPLRPRRPLQSLRPITLTIRLPSLKPHWLATRDFLNDGLWI